MKQIKKKKILKNPYPEQGQELELPNIKLAL